MRERRGPILGAALLAAVLAAALPPATVAESGSDDPPVENIEQLYERGQRHFAAGRWASAKSCFARALVRLGPDGPPLARARSHRWIAACCAREGDLPGMVRARLEDLRLLRIEFGKRKDPELTVALANAAAGLSRAGRAREALPLHEEALEAYLELADEGDLAVAVARANLAGCLSDLGRLGDAIPHYEKALAAFEGPAEGNRTRLARALNNLAFCLVSLGRSREAVPRARRALEVTRAHLGPDHPRTADAHGMLAHCLESAGDLEGALPHRRRGLAIAESLAAGDAPRTAAALHDLASALRDLGRPVEAIPPFRRALAMRIRLFGEEHPDIAHTHAFLAICLSQLHRPAEALRHVDAALPIYRRDPERHRRSLGLELNNRATYLIALGRPAEAAADAEEALAHLRRAHEGDHADVATALITLGTSRRRLGRQDEALAPLREAVAMSGRMFDEDHPLVGTAHNDLALALSRLGRWKEAREIHEQLLAVRRRTHRGDHPRTATGLNNLAVDLHALGEDEAALPLLREALDMRRRLFGDEHADVAQSFNNLGACLAALERPEEALPLERRAVEIAEGLGAPRLHLWQAELGDMLLDRLDRPEEAVPVLESAIDRLEELGRKARGLESLDLGAYLGHLRRFNPYQSLVRARLRLGQHDEAFRAAERGRARTVLDLIANGRFDALAELRRRAESEGNLERRERLDQLASRLERSRERIGRLTHALAAAGIDPMERGRRRDELAAAATDHRRLLRQRARLVRDALTVASPASSKAIRGVLAKTERLLVYSVSPQDAHVLVVPPPGGKIRSHRLSWPDGSPVDEATLSRAIDAYRDGHLSARGGRRSPGGLELEPEEDPHALGARLFSALVPKRVWDEIRRLDRVLVVPHGHLHRIPLEALIVRSVERGPVYWLDEGPPVAYTPSASVLVHCRTMVEERRRSEPAPLIAVALGDPVFSRETAGSPDGTVRASPLLRLPGTRREVLAIRDALRDRGGETGSPERVRVLLGEEATGPRLFELAPRSRFLHLATHHLVDETRHAGLSRLAFTRPRRPTPEDDGFLTLADLLERWRGRLARCELAVLSGCETNRGPLQRDEGLYALPLGFMAAGCPAIVASLWKVDDASSATLMSRFYARLLEDRGDGGKLHALHEARRAVRASHPEPFHWAPFVYIGDPR